MKSYGYFLVLNHIALAVDNPSKEAGFKSLIELDMFNRASSIVLPDAEPKGFKLAKDLTEAIYPASADVQPTIGQRMMIVQALHDQEVSALLGDTTIFVAHSFTNDELMTRFGFFHDGTDTALFMPYYLRKHIMADQAVFCEGKLTSFDYACSNGAITPHINSYGLLTAQAYGHDTMPAKYRHNFLL